MCTVHVDGMEWMNIQDGLDVLSTMGQFVYLPLDRSAERVGIEQHVLAIGPPDQRCLCAYVNDACDPV